MPLLILCGHPLTGKTRRAQEITDHVQMNYPSWSVTLLSESSLPGVLITSFVVSDEKKRRAALLSGVERSLTAYAQSLVIVDAMNGVKGYRYQLYCLARAANTPHMLLWCMASHQEIVSRNHNKEPSNASQSIYPSAYLEELIGRFEEPDGRNRWDAPLLTVSTDEVTPIPEIIKHLLEGKAHRPPSLATRTTAPIGNSLKENANILAMLEPHLNQFISRIREKEHQEIAPPVLDQWKREFLQMLRLHPISSDALPKEFGKFLEIRWNMHQERLSRRKVA